MPEKEIFSYNFVQIMKPFDCILQVLALAPLKQLSGAIVNLSQRERIYGQVQIFLTITMVVLSFIGKFSYSYFKQSTHITTVVLDLVNTCLQTILIIISIRTNITKNNWAHAVEVSSKVSNVCTNIRFSSKDYKNSQIRMFIKSCTVILGTIGVAAADIWISLNLYELQVALCNFYQYWLFFYEFIVFIQIEVKIDLLKQMYYHLNNLIENSLELNLDIEAVEQISTVNRSSLQIKFNIQHTARTHYLLGELIIAINKIHGIQILLIVGTLVLAVLNLLNQVIIIAQDKSGEISIFTYASVFVQLQWCLSLLVVGIIISSRCSSTHDFANDTKVIAQKLLLQERCLLGGNDSDNRIFKYQLQMLSNSGEIPIFSAAGFFAVDFTLIYEVMGAVTTYFIVLLQFAGVTS